MSLLQAPAGHILDANFRTWRFETSGGAPQLDFRDMSPLALDGTPFSKPLIAHSSPNLFQSNAPLPRNDQFSTPTRTQPSFIPRRITDPQKLSHMSSSASPESTEEGSPWCGAVGKASLGKSGRVIERLMADLDKLRRELNAEICKRQEVEKREETNKSAMEALLAESTNLRQAKEIDAAAIKRRDRKIEELKTELENERARRLHAEQVSRDSVQQRDDILAKSSKEISKAKERAKQAEGHAELLGDSHKHLGSEYRRRTEVFADDLQRLTDDRDGERIKVQRLDIVVEQMRHEVGRTNQINLQLNKAFETYKAGTESRMKSLEAEAMEQHEANSDLRKQTQKVVGEARWLINLGHNASRFGARPPDRTAVGW